MVWAGGVRVARDIDRKLRLTAALLGAVTRKDLAAAFRKANPATSFDVGRADKWLQGRAQPRQAQIYDDWTKVLEIDRPGSWIADSDVEEFLSEISERHGRDPEELRRRVPESGSPSTRQLPGLDLAGTYICYSHAWSPYFRGQLIRGVLTITAGSGAGRLAVTYSESLPTGSMDLAGTGSLSKNDLRFDVHDPSGTAQLVTFCLFPPKPPGSVLGGLMFGTTLIGPDAQPSMSRTAMVRLPTASRLPPAPDAYTPAGASIAGDLAAFGLFVHDTAEVDRRIGEFVKSGVGGGFDQVPIENYRMLVDVFDRTWFSVTALPARRLRSV